MRQYIKGPCYSISTACATANYCFHAAANHIRKGDADLIIAGGRASLSVISVSLTCSRFVPEPEIPL